MAPLGHRALGGPGAALADDRFRCEMICDGILTVWSPDWQLTRVI